MTPDQLKALKKAERENGHVNLNDLKALLESHDARASLLREVLGADGDSSFDEAAFADWCTRARAELGLDACLGCGKPMEAGAATEMCAECTVNADLGEDAEATGA